MPLTDRSTAPKKLSDTEEKQFWRAKKKLAYKHLKTAKRTGNGGWVKMLHKRIAKYDRYIKESFDSFAKQVLKDIS